MQRKNKLLTRPFLAISEFSSYVFATSSLTLLFATFGKNLSVKFKIEIMR